MVLLFHNTQSVLTAEELLLEAGLDVDVVPRPEGVPGGLCGIALDVSTARLPEVDTLLSAKGIAYDLFAGAFAVEASAPALVADVSDEGNTATESE